MILPTFGVFCIRQRQPSDIDIGFPAGAGDAELISALQRVLPGELKENRPDLVLYGECQAFRRELHLISYTLFY